MPYPWSANDILTASDLNAAIGTGIVSTGLAAWTAYTPTWSGSVTAPVLGNGSLVGAYWKSGRKVAFRVELTTGSTTTYGSGTYTFTFPTAAVGSGGLWIGRAGIVDVSAASRVMRDCILSSSTGFQLNSEAGVIVTNLAPMTWAVGDTMFMEGFFQSTT